MGSCGNQAGGVGCELNQPQKGARGSKGTLKLKSQKETKKTKWEDINLLLPRTILQILPSFVIFVAFCKAF
jgi:hypothetical protein